MTQDRKRSAIAYVAFTLICLTLCCHGSYNPLVRCQANCPAMTAASPCMWRAAFMGL